MCSTDTANGGLNSLPGPSYTFKQRSWGTLPEHCYDLLQDHQRVRCKATDVEVFDVTFSDVRMAHSLLC